MTTLADKVYNATSERGAVEYANYPTPEENRTPTEEAEIRDLSSYEMDLRDWGVFYGLAYALARSEDAFQDPEELGTRALAAATEAWDRSHRPDDLVPIGQPPEWYVAQKQAEAA